MHKPPIFGEIRFSCPHCGALAHQYWALTRHREVAKNWTPKELHNPLAHMYVTGISAAEALKKVIGKKVTLHDDEDRGNTQLIRNLHSSRCDSCGNISIWLQEKLVYPAAAPTGMANLDMPAQVRTLYDEAGAVFRTSPRAAAALLRLALQHLLIALGEKGDNICEDINKLVDKGLDADTALTMDTIRIVGNESAHPGIINVNEEPEIAAVMFELLNEIVKDMISKPMQKEAIRKILPEKKRVEIERKLAKRDRGDSK